MISLFQIETQLKEALKAKDSLKANTLRGLKARIQNEQTANCRPERSEGSVTDRKELSEPELIALVRSEVKRRRDAQQAYQKGGRQDLAEKEAKEEEILAKIGEVINSMSATARDFGKVMGRLKSELGDSADGGTLARLLKEKLK
jgi:uncharacterized protein